MSTPQVFIVWQNPLFKEMVQAILADAGIGVTGVLSTVEAASLARPPAAQPVYVVTEGDRQDGYTLLQRWADHNAVRVLAFSMDDDRAYCLHYRQICPVTKHDIVRLLLNRERIGTGNEEGKL